MSAIYWNKLASYTAEELTQFGFRLWSVETGLMLIPAILYDEIPPGLELTTIRGEKVHFDPANDDLQRQAGQRDQRYGMLAFGVVPRRSRS